MTIRLGIVSYLNAFPYLYGLEEEKLEGGSLKISFGTPSELNKKVAQKELDIALLSSIELARHSQGYAALPDLGLAVQGKAGSVLLFSQVGLQQLQGQTIAVTSASSTGVVLLRILLERCWGISGVTFQRRMEFKGIRDQFPAVLVIGDDALQAQAEWPSRWVSEDLGQVWSEWTGLPFIFALWIVSKQWSTENPEGIHAVWNQLKKAITFSQQHWPEMIAEAKKRWPSTQQVEPYLFRFNYALDDSHKDGLIAFYQWAKRLGEIKDLPTSDLFIQGGNQCEPAVTLE